MRIPSIGDISFSENAYFYHVYGGGRLSRETVESFVKQACGCNQAYWIGKLRTSNAGNPSVKYSLKIFKSSAIPSYLSTTDNYWKEEKVGYILIIEYDEYVAILKKNAASIKIKGLLEEIPYQTLLNIFMTKDTSITKMHMRNLDNSMYAMQSRIFESNDLKKSVSAFGLNRYFLQSYKGEDSTNGRFSLSMGSSRINWYKTGTDISMLCNWVISVIDAIIAYESPSDNYMSIFAHPISYKSIRDELIPDSLLVYHNQILRVIEDPSAVVEIFDRNGHPKNISNRILMKYLDGFKETLSEVVRSNRRGVDHYHIVSDKRLEIVKGSNSISLSSSALERIKISSHPDPLCNGSLLSIINNNSWFNIYFTNREICYSHRTIFQDHRLLESASYLLDNIKTINALNNTTCEKIHGRAFTLVTKWAQDSVFKVVEDEFLGKFDHFVCDDCEDEWTDHIGVSKGKISFYCSKSDRAICSASAFQDVVAQALKNLGNLTPSETSLDEKVIDWYDTHTTSLIHRYRSKSGSLQEMKNKWIESINNPNTVREMCLVVNFLSKSSFNQFIDQIRTNTITVNKYTKAAYQLLWLLSSFVASCKELGVVPIVYCKP